MRLRLRLWEFLQDLRGMGCDAGWWVGVSLLTFLVYVVLPLVFLGGAVFVVRWSWTAAERWIP